MFLRKDETSQLGILKDCGGVFFPMVAAILVSLSRLTVFHATKDFYVLPCGPRCSNLKKKKKKKRGIVASVRLVAFFPTLHQLLPFSKIFLHFGLSQQQISSTRSLS